MGAAVIGCSRDFLGPHFRALFPLIGFLVSARFMQTLHHSCSPSFFDSSSLVVVIVPTHFPAAIAGSKTSFTCHSGCYHLSIDYHRSIYFCLYQ